MRRIAHLSDVHLIAPNSSRATYGLRSRALRFGRTSDPSLRARKLAAALQAVVASGADHLVVSGDLTELGDDAEFELFAEVLEAAGIPAENVTLVPGNHDAYTTADGWSRALEGPLALHPSDVDRIDARPHGRDPEEDQAVSDRSHGRGMGTHCTAAAVRAAVGPQAEG